MTQFPFTSCLLFSLFIQPSPLPCFCISGVFCMQALLCGAPCSLEGEVMRVCCSNVKVRMEQVQTEHPCWCSTKKKKKIPVV